MRITASDNYRYHNELECDLQDCGRNWCALHRRLYRDCETAKKSTEGDRDVIGGLRTVIERGDCPNCERAAEIRRMQLHHYGH